MAHTGAFRSSALGTRIAAVAPPPFSAVPETIPVAPASETWDWHQTESAPRADAPRASRATTRRTKSKSTRPTSAPLRRRPGCEGKGAVKVTPESHRNATPGHLRQATGWEEEVPRGKKPITAASVRLGQVRMGGVQGVLSHRGRVPNFLRGSSADTHARTSSPSQEDTRSFILSNGFWWLGAEVCVAGDDCFW